jgi:hypothetical protein
MDTIINRAVRCTAMLGYVDGERVSIALVRTDATGDFQWSSHGVYWMRDQARAVAEYLVRFLNQTAQTRGWFNYDDVQLMHRRAEAAVLGY